MKKLTFFSLLFLLFSTTVFAAPHITRSAPEPREYPGRTLQERADGAMREGIMPAAPTVPYTTPQTVKVLFLRVEFPPDQDPLTTGSGMWTDPLYTYNNNVPDYWVNRARTSFPQYWTEVSYGLLTVNIDVSSKIYLLPHVMTDYAGGTAGPIENFIYDSITTASTGTTAIDFTQYDGVFIIHAGVGQETDTKGTMTNDLWSLYYSGGTKICRDAGNNTPCVTVTLKDNKVLSEAIIMPQTDARTNVLVEALGVYVHEFGHWLGLPDLYCTLTTGCPVEGVGNWSLMDEGSYNADSPTGIRGSTPAHLDAWCLKSLGWVHPQTIASYQSSHTLGPVESSATQAAGTNVLLATASTGSSSQYFLIENRQNIGFDAGLPGHGLLVWLIDDAVVIPGLNTNSINNGKHPGIKLIEADGNWDLQNFATHDYGSAGDPFPGSTNNTALTPVTRPSATAYTDYGNVNIRNITETGQQVSFSIGFGPLPPTGLIVNAGTKTLSWTASAGAVDYYIYKNQSQTRLGSTGAALSFVDTGFYSTDYYEVTAVDTNGNESQAATLGIPPVVTVTNTGTGTGTNTSGSSGGGGHKGPCFIATAAYGSYLDPHVETLRNFRNRHLLTNPVGRAFVSFYYQYSPPIADYIGRHETLRTVTRWALTPVVFAAEYPIVFLLLFATGVLFAGRKILAPSK